MQPGMNAAPRVESASWSGQHQAAPAPRVESASWSGQHQVAPAPGGNLPPTTMRMLVPQQMPPPQPGWPQPDPRYAYGAPQQQPYGGAPPGGYGMPSQQPMVQPAAMMPVAPKRSSRVWLFLVALVLVVAAGAAAAVLLRMRG
jgi:hypothetical protein